MSDNPQSYSIKTSLETIYFMALIKSVRGFTPEIGENCFLADNATIIGDVKIGNDCSIWFCTVLRGDVNSIFRMEACYILYMRSQPSKLVIMFP